MADELVRKDNDVFVPFLRRLAEVVARVLSKTFITPNQVTVGSFLAFVPAIGYLFARGTYVDNVLALVLIGVTLIFDLSDGMLARLTGKSSTYGAYLDASLDKIFQYMILATIPCGVFRITDEPRWLVVGIVLLSAQAMADFVGARYEKEFGFDAYSGSMRFQELVNALPDASWVDRFFANLIVPCHRLFIALFTIRYWLIFAIIFNQMHYFLIIGAVVLSVRWLLIWFMYLMFLSGSTRLGVLECLRVLKKESSRLP